MIILFLLVVGLVFGSFAGAQIWRLRANQLLLDKRDGQTVDRAEYSRLVPRLANTTLSNDHSRCLSCGHRLHWYDLLPLVSWLSTGGRCRYCKKPIGWFEPVIEISLALAFVVSYLAWPFEIDSALAIAHYIVWLVALVVLAVLFAYDAKWFLLPDMASGIFAATALVFTVLHLIIQGFSWDSVWSLIASIAILSGLYAVLYYYSRAKFGEEGTWVGFGDVKLGIGLGLLVLTWQNALVALFAANLLGTLIVLPGLLTGRINRKAQIPLGPLLILGAYVSVLFGPHLWRVIFSIAV